MRPVAALIVIGMCGFPACGQTSVGGASGNRPPEQSSRSTAGSSESGAPLATLRLLNARIGDFQFEEAPLEDVFAWLGEVAGVNLVVRWGRLEDLGIERDHPISVNARNLRFSQVLWLVMNEAAADDSQLAYRADPDLILISTAEDIGRPMVVKVYHVRDLIAPRLQAPEFISTRERQVVVGNTVTVAAGAVAVTPITQGFGSGVFFGGEGTLNQPRPEDEENEGDSQEEYLEKLVDIITTAIEPDSWAVNGGLGTISAFRGTLVIRNSPLVHQKIGGYLRSGELP